MLKKTFKIVLSSFILIVFLFMFKNINLHIETVPKNKNSFQLESLEEGSEFNAFILTTYIANESEQMLTSNYFSELKPTTLQTNVETILPSYSPLISSVPGIPFTFDVLDSANELSVTANHGTLYKWNSKTGEVSEYKPETILSKGQTLYWSPVGKDGNIAKNDIIEVVVFKNEQIVAKQNISIYSKNSVFTATIEELDTFYQGKNMD